METDVIVVGFGAAGAVAAIEAADAGARVVLIEKMAFPGGLSIASAGGIRVSHDPAAALSYLEATCGGRTPSSLLRVLADGMATVPDYMRRLAARNGATVRVTPALGNYPLPGYEALAYCEVEAVPSLEGLPGYHAMQPVKNGTRLFKVLEDNVEARKIDVMFETPAQRLIVEDGIVTGLTALRQGSPVAIRARKGVILACGGFEADVEMQRQYFQVGEVLTGSFLGNTGDGIRMAQAVGADLWHMWHYHGPYGIEHPDPAYPFGLYLKAVPMWTPGRTDYVSDLGISSGPNKVSEKSLARVAWILLDQTGQRFMDEYPPYPGDTGVRPFDAFDPKTQRFPRNPAFIVFDEIGRNMYPLGRVVYNDHHPRYTWSSDNSAEIANGIFQRADDIPQLAAIMNVPEARLIASLARWNDAVRTRYDVEFGRQPETMVAIETPPFYVGRVRPLVINTQGGPRHNEYQQVLDPFGEPIARLYAAGELGSLFGHLYMSGGNLTECIVGGSIAGKHAADQEPLPSGSS
jgi:succinate dehydrogenase/fumarate reductase flavoprotein subunit